MPPKSRTSDEPAKKRQRGVSGESDSRASRRLSEQAAKQAEDRGVDAEISEFFESIGIDELDSERLAVLDAKLNKLRGFVGEHEKEKELEQKNRQLDLEIRLLQDEQSDQLDQLTDDVELAAALRKLGDMQSDGLQSADRFDSVPFVPARPDHFPLLHCDDYYQPGDGLLPAAKRRRRPCPMLDDALLELVMNHDGKSSLFRSGFLSFLIGYEPFPDGVVTWIAQEAFFSPDRATREAALTVLKSSRTNALLPVSFLDNLLPCLHYRHIFPLFEILQNQASRFLYSIDCQSSSQSSSSQSSSNQSSSSQSSSSQSSSSQSSSNQSSSSQSSSNQSSSSQSSSQSSSSQSSSSSQASSSGQSLSEPTSSSEPISSSEPSLSEPTLSSEVEQSDESWDREWFEFVLCRCVVPAFFDRNLYTLRPLLQDVLRALIDGMREADWLLVDFAGLLSAALARLPAGAGKQETCVRLLHLIRQLPTSSPRSQQLQHRLAFGEMHRLFERPLPAACSETELKRLLDYVYVRHIRPSDSRLRLDWRRLFVFYALLDICLTRSSLPRSANSAELRAILEKTNNAIRENPNRSIAPTQCKDILTVLINRMRLFCRTPPPRPLHHDPSNLEGLSRSLTQTTLHQFFAAQPDTIPPTSTIDDDDLP